MKLSNAFRLLLYSDDSAGKAALETMVEMMGASRSARMVLTCVRLGTSKNGLFRFVVEESEVFVAVPAANARDAVARTDMTELSILNTVLGRRSKGRVGRELLEKILRNIDEF